MKRRFPAHFVNTTVLDVGSQDINGNNRHLFENCTYLGCDVVAGKNVDHVGPCWTLPEHVGPFMTVISTEMLEHDPTWERSVATMERLVAPGGLLLITCAAPGRKIHNTEPGGYYRNLSPKQVLSALDLSKWQKHSAVYNEAHHDVHLWAIKK